MTHSKPSDFPSPLRDKRSEVQEVREGDVQQDSIIKQQCEKCPNDQIRFFQIQMRSADEGSTVQYKCTQCGYRWSTNN